MTKFKVTKITIGEATGNSILHLETTYKDVFGVGTVKYCTSVKSTELKVGDEISVNLADYKVEEKEFEVADNDGVVTTRSCRWIRR